MNLVDDPDQSDARAFGVDWARATKHCDWAPPVVLGSPPWQVEVPTKFGNVDAGQRAMKLPEAILAPLHRKKPGL